MSEAKGIEFIEIFNGALNAEDMISCLRYLSQLHGKEPSAIFLDQASIHKAKDVRPFYSLYEMAPVFNIGYSPMFNPIEAVFSKVKAYFNAQRMHHLVNKTPFDTKRTIKDAFERVTQKTLRRLREKELPSPRNCFIT